MKRAVKKILEAAGYDSLDALAARYIKLDFAYSDDWDKEAEALGLSPLDWSGIRMDDEFVQAVYKYIIITEAGTPDAIRERLRALQQVASDPKNKSMVQAAKFIEQQLGVLRKELGDHGLPRLGLDVRLINPEPIATPGEDSEVRTELPGVRAQA